MRSYTLSATVDERVIRGTPVTLVMTIRDEIRWTGTNARGFSMEFDGDRPFGGRRLAHAAATPKQTPRTKGRPKDTVVSDENPGLRLDPVIVVDPPPTEGRQGGE